MAEQNGAPATRIFQVVNTPYGIRTQVAPIAEALAARGIGVDIGCPGGPRTAAAIPRHPLIRHVELPISRRLLDSGHARIAARIRALIRERSYSILHLHGPIPATLGRLAAVGTDASTIYHCRGTFYEGGRPLLSEKVLSAVYPLIERALGHRTDIVFTLNEADARDLRERARIPAARVRCLGVGSVGVDLKDWWGAGLDPVWRTRARLALRVPEDRFVVGFVGRLVRLKGIPELWRAFQQLCAMGHDAHLVLLGDLPDSERDQETLPRLRRQIHESGLADRVTLPGYVEDPLPLIAGMDVLALPSYWEPFGMVFSEAGGLGVPVIGTRTRGGVQAIRDGETGLLVDKHDVDQLAAALLRLAGDRDAARRMGTRAVAHVQNEHNRSRVLREILAAYSELLGRNLGNPDNAATFQFGNAAPADGSLAA